MVTKNLLKQTNAFVKLIAALIFITALIVTNSIITLIALILIIILFTIFDKKSINLIHLNANNLIPSSLVLLIAFIITSTAESALIITLKYMLFINYGAFYLKNTSERDITDSIIYLLKPFKRILNTYRIAVFLVAVIKWLPNYYEVGAKLKYLKKYYGLNLNSFKHSSNIKRRIRNHYHTLIISIVLAFNLEKNMQIRAADVPYSKKRLKLKITKVDILYLSIHGILIILLLKEVIL